jgi:hypothetical protein
LNPYFQCNHDDADTDDTAPPATDDDAAPPPSTDDDDYWPKNDDGTFDDDAAVDDDAAPVVNDDAAATDDDDANNNDDVDTDDQTPSTDDQTPSTDDDAANADDDANNDNYEKKLMECLAVGNQTACAKNTPTACIWCTTSFGTGLCVSEQASHDVDGHFYTCQFNSTFSVVTPSAEVYDHYCWNAQQEEACLEQVDGRDVPCVWSDEHDMCLSQAQVDLLELPKLAKEY